MGQRRYQNLWFYLWWANWGKLVPPAFGRPVNFFVVCGFCDATFPMMSFMVPLCDLVTSLCYFANRLACTICTYRKIYFYCLWRHMHICIHRVYRKPAKCGEIKKYCSDFLPNWSCSSFVMFKMLLNFSQNQLTFLYYELFCMHTDIRN